MPNETWSHIVDVSSVAASEAASEAIPPPTFLTISLAPPLNTSLASFIWAPLANAFPPSKPARFNKPLVANSKPASIVPEPVALKSKLTAFCVGSSSNSSSYLVPAVDAPKAIIPAGPKPAASIDGKLCKPAPTALKPPSAKSPSLNVSVIVFSSNSKVFLSIFSINFSNGSPP